MERTQIYLGEEELALLKAAVDRTGASRSELIRRAIRTSFGNPGPDDRMRSLEQSAGSWQGRSFTGAEYVDELRSDLAKRIRELNQE